MKKKISFLIIVSLLIVMISANTVLAKIDTVAIGTGGTGGTFYPVGVDISTLWNDTVKEEHDINFSAHTSGGSIENLQMIQSGEINVGISGAVLAFQAYQGSGGFKGVKLENVRYISSLYTEADQFVFREKLDIESIADLEGKKVSVGPPGGAGVLYVPMHLKAIAGLSFADIDVEYMSYSDAAQALQDGLIDVGYFGGPVPISGVSQVFASADVDMIDYTKEDLEKLEKEYPFYSDIKVPANTYIGQKEEKLNAAIRTCVVVDKNLDKDLVYSMTAAFHKKLDWLKERHPVLRTLTLENALSGLGEAPLHPGSYEYYKDQGLDIAEYLIPPEYK